MKLIVGLGNPGARYANTRHNIGARVVRALAEELGVSLEPRETLFGRYGAGRIGAAPVSLLLPDTWMNASGASVAAALARLEGVEVARDLLVVLDDVDLPFGRIRLRARGSDGGHRGLRDVLAALGTEQVARLRIGVGRGGEPGSDTKQHVLDAFASAELEALPALIERASAALRCFAEEGIAEAMNRFNGLPPVGSPDPPIGRVKT
jgi:PTH1 family peptidyl-tRNA hydrolase